MKPSLAISYGMKKRKKMAYGTGNGPVKKDDVPEPNKANAAAIQKGSTSKGTSMAEGWKNLKKGLGMAEGGQIKGNYQSPSTAMHQTRPDLDHTNDMESGYVDHMGNDLKRNDFALRESERLLNQHGELEQGPYGTRYADGGQVAQPIKKAKPDSEFHATAEDFRKAGMRMRGQKPDEEEQPRTSRYAEGGDVGGAKTSTTGNKTKTGGSNPGGASTGGAGTVTITTGKMPPKGINISNVGGKTAARNAGGMDPSDEDDAMMMAEGGILNQEPVDDMVGRIIKKMQHHYSEGGKIANGGQDELSHMAGGSPNNFDDLSLRDDLEFSYTGANSGDEIGNDQEDYDRKDIVSRIMRSRAKKDRMPPSPY